MTIPFYQVEGKVKTPGYNCRTICLLIIGSLAILCKSLTYKQVKPGASLDVVDHPYFLTLGFFCIMGDV